MADCFSGGVLIPRRSPWGLMGLVIFTGVSVARGVKRVHLDAMKTHKDATKTPPGEVAYVDPVAKDHARVEVPVTEESGQRGSLRFLWWGSGMTLGELAQALDVSYSRTLRLFSQGPKPRTLRLDTCRHLAEVFHVTHYEIQARNQLDLRRWRERQRILVGQVDRAPEKPPDAPLAPPLRTYPMDGRSENGDGDVMDEASGTTAGLRAEGP